MVSFRVISIFEGFSSLYIMDRKILGGIGICRENNLEEEGRDERFSRKFVEISSRF